MMTTLIKNKFYRLKDPYNAIIYYTNSDFGLIKPIRNSYIHNMVIDKPLMFANYSNQKIGTHNKEITNCAQFKYNDYCFYMSKDDVTIYTNISQSSVWNIELEDKQYNTNNNQFLSILKIGELYTLHRLFSRLYLLKNNQQLIISSLSSERYIKKIILLDILNKVFYGTNHTYVLKVLWNNKILYTLPNYIMECYSLIHNNNDENVQYNLIHDHCS